MYLNDKINQLLSKLKSCEKLNDIKFIKAYPYAKKATILKGMVATLSPGDMKIESVSMDNLSYYGSFGVNIDLYAPCEMGSPVTLDAMERIINEALDISAIGVKVGTIEKDEVTSCFKACATITFNGAISKEEVDG